MQTIKLSALVELTLLQSLERCAGSATRYKHSQMLVLRALLRLLNSLKQPCAGSSNSVSQVAGTSSSSEATRELY